MLVLIGIKFGVSLKNNLNELDLEPIFESIFPDINIKIPIAYFKYYDGNMLENAIEQLKIITNIKMPLLKRLEKLQFSFLLLERVYFIGPPDFDQDLWSIK